MKAVRFDTENKIESSSMKKMVSPFVKLIEDKERIDKAVQNDQSLSSLKDIKFVRPI